PFVTTLQRVPFKMPNEAVENVFSCPHRAVNQMEYQDSKQKYLRRRNHGPLQADRHQPALHCR
ncbi:MAG: hypothetical protein Q7U75_15780, partial [Desulfobacterales bacterium]|nr:hypothetical protein [Desulfobacterales bacterium]